MTTATFTLLALYSLAIAACSMLGGMLPQRVNFTHTRMQLVMSLVSGLMLGVAFFHLLPHGIVELDGAVDVAMRWLMIGLVVMLMLLRMFHFHQHDFSPEEVHHHDHPHAHPHPHDDTHAHPLSWLGVALGLGLHTVIDGVALGAVVLGGAGEGLELVGLGVFLAIALHKPLDAMSITSLMEAGGWSPRARWIANAGFALLCPLGAFGFYLLGVGLDTHFLVGCALAFSAGTFICIALSDLLPEIHFHSHDRVKLTVLFLVGIGLALAIGVLEPVGTHPG